MCWPTCSPPTCTVFPVFRISRTVLVQRTGQPASAPAARSTGGNVRTPCSARARHSRRTGHRHACGYLRGPGDRPPGHSTRANARAARTGGYVAHACPSAPTRGTTNPNRLRRMDRWIAAAHAGRLRRAADPVAVDLGYGAAPGPRWSCSAGCARCAPTPRSSGSRSTRRGSRRPAPFERPRAAFLHGGFEIPLPGGRRPVLIRAANVLRQYDEARSPRSGPRCASGWRRAACWSRAPATRSAGGTSGCARSRRPAHRDLRRPPRLPRPPVRPRRTAAEGADPPQRARRTRPRLPHRLRPGLGRGGTVRLAGRAAAVDPRGTGTARGRLAGGGRACRGGRGRSRWRGTRCRGGATAGCPGHRKPDPTRRRRAPPRGAPGARQRQPLLLRAVPVACARPAAAHACSGLGHPGAADSGRWPTTRRRGTPHPATATGHGHGHPVTCTLSARLRPHRVMLVMGESLMEEEIPF